MDGLGYNRYNGKANGRNMINGVACVKFNKSVPLVDLIDKVNNVATPTSPPSKQQEHQEEASGGAQATSAYFTQSDL